MLGEWISSRNLTMWCAPGRMECPLFLLIQGWIKPMRISFWQSVKKLVAAGLFGFGATTAQAFDEQPIRLQSFDEVYNLNDKMMYRDQSCVVTPVCDLAGTCDYSAGCCDDNCECIGNWRDNSQIWIGGDAYKSLGDQTPVAFPSPLALTNSFGMVGGFNTGLALGDSRVRAQVGGSYGLYDLKGRTTVAPGTDNSLEQQTFFTAGFYKRSDILDCDRISWGLVYDTLWDHQWGWQTNEVFLGQVRGILGYALNECNEVGVWGTFHTQSDKVSLSPFSPLTEIRTMNQANAYLRHNWAFGGSSMAYVGAVDKADIASWQFGLLNLVPVSHNTSVYANYTYVAPGSATGLVGAAEEQWNVSVGLMYSFGGKAVSSTVSGRAGLPLLPVANNGSFLITN